jgi:hypothetical protein
MRAISPLFKATPFSQHLRPQSMPKAIITAVGVELARQVNAHRALTPRPSLVQGLRPLSTWPFHHSFSVCAVQPILPAMDKIAARLARRELGLVIQHHPYQARADLGRELFAVLFVIAPSSQKLGLQQSGAVRCRTEVNSIVRPEWT